MARAAPMRVRRWVLCFGLALACGSPYVDDRVHVQSVSGALLVHSDGSAVLVMTVDYINGAVEQDVRGDAELVTDDHSIDVLLTLTTLEGQTATHFAPHEERTVTWYGSVPPSYGWISWPCGQQVHVLDVSVPIVCTT